MSPATISFLVLGAVVVLFVWNRLPVEVVAVGAALTLYATGVLDLRQTFAGFGDPVVAFIAGLFVVAEALDATGVTAWACQELSRRTGSGRKRTLVASMLLAAGLTALITVNGAVAALLPMVVILAVRQARSPSGFLMPLAFGAHAGSMLTLTGTPINVIVASAAVEAGGRTFGFFEFALVGVPLVAGVTLISVLFGRRLLPERTPSAIPADLSEHARTLTKQYRLDENAFRLEIEAISPFVGVPVGAVDLGHHPELTLLGVQSAGRSGRLEVADVLIVRGEQEAVARFARAGRMTFLPGPVAGHVAGALLDRDYGLAEVMVAPRSDLVGATVFPGMVARDGELVILAVQRKGYDQGPAETVLAIGDTLLVQGTWRALDRAADADLGLMPVDSHEALRRQAVPLGRGAKRAIAVLAAMVVLLATGVVPPAIAAVLAAGAMVVLRVVSMTEAYRGISWTTVVVVAGMIPVATAIEGSGAADTLANGLVAVVGDAGPYALLLGLFVMTAVLGQLISNTATALIVIPVAVAAAANLGVSIQPVMMSLTVAAAAAFLTPVATPANLMVMGPGGYRFGDYWKFGLPMLLWFGVVAVLVVPIFWRF
jgi:di/tricarboxylate transporter